MADTTVPTQQSSESLTLQEIMRWEEYGILHEANPGLAAAAAALQMAGGCGIVGSVSQIWTSRKNVERQAGTLHSELTRVLKQYPQPSPTKILGIYSGNVFSREHKDGPRQLDFSAVYTICTAVLEKIPPTCPVAQKFRDMQSKAVGRHPGIS